MYRLFCLLLLVLQNKLDFQSFHCKIHFRQVCHEKKCLNNAYCCVFLKSIISSNGWKKGNFRTMSWICFRIKITIYFSIIFVLLQHVTENKQREFPRLHQYLIISTYTKIVAKRKRKCLKSQGLEDSVCIHFSLISECYKIQAFNTTGTLGVWVPYSK